jgi:hypothetical protein
MKLSGGVSPVSECFFLLLWFQSLLEIWFLEAGLWFQPLLEIRFLEAGQQPRDGKAPLPQRFSIVVINFLYKALAHGGNNLYNIYTLIPKT